MAHYHITPSHRQRPPTAPGLPLIGHAHQFMGDPMPFFLEKYREFGPVFRLSVANREYVVMAGLEANMFLAREGDELLSSEVLFGPMGREMGADQFLVAMDGPPHRHLRKLMRAGYAKTATEPHLADLVRIARECVSSWKPGQPISVLDNMQWIAFQEISQVIYREDMREHFEDARIVFRYLLNVLMIQRWPRFMLKHPRYLKAKRALLQLAKELVAKQELDTDLRSLLLSDLVTATDLDGHPYSEGDQLMFAMGPFAAGLDSLASTLGFMLYALVSRPGVMARVRAEVDLHFKDEAIPVLRDLPRLEALYGACIEVLRLHPVTPFIPRMAAESFEFAGYQIEQGDQLLILTGLTHFMPEYFPEPYQFDIDRYRAPRSEHRQALGVLNPYGLGGHSCLGAGMAEVLLMITTAALVQSATYEMDPPDYQLKTRLTPIPSPDRGFKVKVIKHRH
ncbi:MAG: cytochrome P450 [Chloroflexi bacterium]|nr:cytochrome P450 [Chloroflexota bacterium]